MGAVRACLTSLRIPLCERDSTCQTSVEGAKLLFERVNEIGFDKVD